MKGLYASSPLARLRGRQLQEERLNARFLQPIFITLAPAILLARCPDGWQFKHLSEEKMSSAALL